MGELRSCDRIGEVLISRVGDRVWVVQSGLRSRRDIYKHDFYHVHLNGTDFSCTCPSAETSRCVHLDYFTQYRQQVLEEEVPDCRSQDIVPFLLDRIDFAAFSVRSSLSDQNSSKRVIVRLKDVNRWSCGGCKRKCRHIEEARKEAIRLRITEESGGIPAGRTRPRYAFR